ncbi:hypothetical protein JW777_10335 [bacterium]|nr:hypothetical protein [bacterium]
MKTLFKNQSFGAFLIACILMAAVAFGGGSWFKTDAKWGVELGAKSDTLKAATGKDTTSSFLLQVESGSGRGYDIASAMSVNMKVRETTTSDSARLIVFLDVSDDATTWYPWKAGLTALLDTCKLQGTANETKYWTYIVTAVPANKYGRIRANAAGTTTDSVWVDDVDIGFKY